MEKYWRRPAMYTQKSSSDYPECPTRASKTGISHCTSSPATALHFAPTCTGSISDDEIDQRPHQAAARRYHAACRRRSIEIEDVDGSGHEKLKQHAGTNEWPMTSCSRAHSSRPGEICMLSVCTHGRAAPFDQLDAASRHGRWLR
jgi:hypothetical protein